MEDSNAQIKDSFGRSFSNFLNSLSLRLLLFFLLAAACSWLLAAYALPIIQQPLLSKLPKDFAAITQHRVTTGQVLLTAIFTAFALLLFASEAIAKPAKRLIGFWKELASAPTTPVLAPVPPPNAASEWWNLYRLSKTVYDKYSSWSSDEESGAIQATSGAWRHALLGAGKDAELEAEIEFAAMLTRELDKLSASKDLFQSVLDRLSDKYPKSLQYGVAFVLKADSSEYADVARTGFYDETLALLRECNHVSLIKEVCSSQRYRLIESNSFNALGLAPLADNSVFKQAIYLPVTGGAGDKAVLAFYFKATSPAKEKVRLLRNIAECTGRVYPWIVRLEQQLEAARHDASGLLNRKSLTEDFPKVVSEYSEQGLVLLVVDVDSYAEIEGEIGAAKCDVLVGSLGKLVAKNIRQNLLGGDEIARCGPSRLAVSIQSATAENALALAERLRQIVNSSTNWPAEIPPFTCSSVIVSYPQDGKDIEQLLATADKTFKFFRDKGEFDVCHLSSIVPADLRNPASRSQVSGSLGMFDSEALVRSLKQAKKTGFLTVRGDAGVAWVYFEQGDAKRARLGELSGRAAFFELLTSLNQGNFNFQEHTGRKATSGLLRPEDDAIGISEDLEVLLQEARKQLSEIKNTQAMLTEDAHLQTVSAIEHELRWRQLLSGGTTVGASELEMLNRILEACDGSLSITEMRAKLHLPSHTFWHTIRIAFEAGFIKEAAEVAR